MQEALPFFLLIGYLIYTYLPTLSPLPWARSYGSQPTTLQALDKPGSWSSDTNCTNERIVRDMLVGAELSLLELQTSPLWPPLFLSS